MFAVLHLPQFPLQAALRHEPELWARPVALVDPALTTPRVCDCTGPARAAGVELGFTPTQALARCRDILIRHRSSAQEGADADAVLQCAYGFSPNIEHTSPGTVTIDLRGLAELCSRRRKETDQTGGEEVSASSPRRLQNWATRLRTALAAFSLTARIGTGPTPNIARHAARWCEGIEIVTDPASFIAKLPVAALEPSTDVALVLHKWGIRTVGELLALGQDALVDRLGLEALALFAAASTTALRPLNLVRPAERFEEAFDYEHPIETLEPLLFILRRFVDALSQRLELTDLVAELLTLKLRLESGEALERRFRV
ncbi:MAG TPA: DNA polymerase Y family protein, partial [Verrucomicrobiae bacterium]